MSMEFRIANYLKQRNAELAPAATKHIIVSSSSNEVDDDDDDDANEEHEDEQQQWSVKAVLDERGLHPTQEFMVSWDGVDPATNKAWDDSWQGVECFFGEQDMRIYTSNPQHLPPAVLQFYEARRKVLCTTTKLQNGNKINDMETSVVALQLRSQELGEQKQTIDRAIVIMGRSGKKG